MREKQNYVEVLLNQRHMKERCLEATIKKLESKKKVRETELFLTQRKFFIDQVFDNHNELRFVKFKDQKEKHKQLPDNEEESKTKDRQNKTESRRKSATAQETDKKNLFLTEQLFMEKSPLKSSANLVRIQNAEIKLHQAVLKKQNSISSITLKRHTNEKETKLMPRRQSSRSEDIPQFTVTNEKGEIGDVLTPNPTIVRPALRVFKRIASVPSIKVPGRGEKFNIARRNTAPNVAIGSPRERFTTGMKKPVSHGSTASLSARKSQPSLSCNEYLETMSESEGKKVVMNRHLASFLEMESNELHNNERLDCPRSSMDQGKQYDSLLPVVSDNNFITPLSSTRGTPEMGKGDIHEKDTRHLTRKTNSRSPCQRLSVCRPPNQAGVRIAFQQSNQGLDEERKIYFGEKIERNQRENESTLRKSLSDVSRRDSTVQQKKLSCRANPTVQFIINQEADESREKLLVKNVMDDKMDLDKRQEKLLKRLSSSLPLHLLAKAQSRASGFSEVLGFTKRNKTLMEIERRKGSTLCSGDKRFENLMGSLCSPQKKKTPFNFVF